ncbi:MAG: hypothetical protein ACI4LT_00425 [Treponema sp.]
MTYYFSPHPPPSALKISYAIFLTLFNLTKTASGLTQVLNMSLTEFDQEEYDRNRFNEGKEAGIAEGKRDTALQNARNFKYKNIPVDIIAECTGLSIEQVNAL